MKTAKLTLCLTALLLMIVSAGQKAVAATPSDEAPQITMFYPGANPEAPVVFTPGIQAYTYFEAGSQVVSCKGNVMQNGESLGHVTYLGRTPAGTLTTMDSTRPENNAVYQTQPGVFSIEIFEVVYLKGGEEYIYSNEAQPVATVTYRRTAPNGVVVSETGFEDELFISYYPADSDKGVKTYTFNKPVVPDKISVYLEYGMGDQYVTLDVPHTLSDDGLTLTIDFRGKRYGVDDIAPGVTWYDEMGNQVPPPTTISLNVNGLNCTDGTLIEYKAYSLGHEYSTIIRGSLYLGLNYEDQSFQTPVLSSVEFYAKANPSVRYAAINDDTDMMDLIIIGAENIVKADMIITVGSVSARIADADIIKTNEAFTVALPESIKKAGSEDMVVSLDAVTFAYDDGGTHVIKPYGLSEAIPEVLTIAQMKKLAPNQQVVLNAVKGVNVTMANDEGYTFVEDEADGLMVTTADYSRVLTQGTQLKGRIVGTYMGYGVFVLNKDASSYVEEAVDVTDGANITSLEQLADGAYDFRLITIEASAQTPIDIDNGMIVIAGQIPVITDFIPNFEAPDQVINVTGIYYVDPSLNQAYILVRSLGDFNHATGTPVVNTIADLKAVAPSECVLAITGAKVTYANEDYGMIIIEDETGAIMLYAEDFSLIAESGDVITAKLTGEILDETTLYVSEYEVEVTANVDVTTGALISIEEANDPTNLLRLVTFVNSDKTPIEPSGWLANIGGTIDVVDYFDVLDWNYKIPAKIASITGILIAPSAVVMDDFDQDEPSVTMLLSVRSEADIEEDVDGITSISTDAAADTDIYDLRGVRVRQAGESTNGLQPGIYLKGNKKVRVSEE